MLYGSDNALSKKEVSVPECESISSRLTTYPTCAKLISGAQSIRRVIKIFFIYTYSVSRVVYFVNKKRGIGGITKSPLKVLASLRDIQVHLKNFDVQNRTPKKQ